MHNFKFKPTLKLDSEFSYRQAIADNYPTFTPSPERYSVSETPDPQLPLRYRFEYHYDPSDPSDSVDQIESVSDDTTASFNPREVSTPISQGSVCSFASSFVPLDTPVPPSHVELSDYYKWVPPDLTPLQKTQQLIIWLAKREANKEIAPETHVDPRAIRAKTIANDLKIKVIEGLERGDVHLSWYNRPDKMEQFEEKENPINIHNEEKLASLSQTNALIEAEIDDWKTYSEKIYEAHAEAKDALLQDTSLRYNDIDIESMLPHLDEQQQKFYLRYCIGEEEEREEVEAMLENHSVISPGVTQIRHTLNTANQFALASQRFIHHRSSNLAKQICEKARIIPIEYDDHPEGVFYDEKHKKECELRNIQRLLRFSKSSAE